MNKLYDEIVTYLQENVPNYESSIKQYGLEYLLNEEYKKVNLKMYQRNSVKINRQVQKSELLYHELLQIAQEFEKNGIKLVHLKGIVLVKDLLDGDFQKRRVRDIDLLVSYHDAYKAMNLLSKMDYRYEKEKENITEESVAENLTQIVDRRIHFPVLEKKCTYQGKDFMIYIDLHIALTHSGNNKAEFADEAVARATFIDCDGTKMYTLVPNDQILFLVQHLTKEYFRNNVRWLITGSRKIDFDSRFPLNLLHDIALLIYKYKENLDWNVVIDRAKLAGSYNDLVFVTKVLKIIYSTMREIIPLYDYTDTDTLDKMIGRFYAFGYAMENEKVFLTQSIDEFSKDIIKTAIKECTGIDSNTEYYVKYIEKNDFAGCRLYESDDDALLKVKFALKKEGVEVYIKEYENISTITVTIGYYEKHMKLQSYIDKYSVKTDKEIQIEAKNGYGSVKIDHINRIDQMEFSFLVPYDFEDLDAREVLVDIELPDYDDGEKQANCIHKDIIDNGTFVFSPKFLYCLKSKKTE